VPLAGFFCFQRIRWLRSSCYLRWYWLLICQLVSAFRSEWRRGLELPGCSFLIGLPQGLL